MLDLWEQQGIYGQIRQVAKGRPDSFCMTALPMQMGISIWPRSQSGVEGHRCQGATLAGFDAPYVPGWDCHGLPIEHQVERKQGKALDKLSARDFRKACREYATNR
ncbi:MAG: hypothetical protein CM1200mP36_08410 [Gammaproteobacteria bacterium]|nr:MAG: hypothetical protein CM1200mP36_08410 [Gammaproteobacteria bacterium]